LASIKTGLVVADDGEVHDTSHEERCEDRTMSTGNESLSIEKLIELLQDTDPLVRIHAGFVLGTMGEEAFPAVPILIEMLEYGDVPTQKLAATTLGQIGPAAVEAVSTLLSAASDDEDEDVSDLAIWALEQIDLADEEPGTEAA
jgi:HEAT repeat protein